MYVGVGLLFVLVTILSVASLHGMWKFRRLTKSIRARSIELPLAADLGQKVSDLRASLWEADHQLHDNGAFHPVVSIHGPSRGIFSQQINDLRESLDEYRFQLTNSEVKDPRMGEISNELKFVEEFEYALDEIDCMVTEGDWFKDVSRNRLINSLKRKTESLQYKATELPHFMKERMQAFSKLARTEYTTWLWLNFAFGLFALMTIGLLVYRLRSGIVLPMVKLLEGSRQVAAGNYDYRIRLNSDDEVAELGQALNAMTQNFQEISSDLNNQVKLRTKEVVRSEKMASVGFLAAGVAHEINNPLASIAWSAESLESRLHDILNPDEDEDQESRDHEIGEMKKYLARIQEEAFRCKEITAGLLDFSRMGEPKKTPTNLSEVIESVIDIVKPLSKYRNKNIHFHADRSIVATVNSQEMKQVALNLITNALSCVEVGGTVEISVLAENEKAVFRVSDNGCGMTSEVQKHLFEPFFTRRRDGQGTGLGLAITYQIIEEHDGKIVPFSRGPGQGSTFTITLPLVNTNEKRISKAA
jgi:signal transduction histidine kinase